MKLLALMASFIGLAHAQLPAGWPGTVPNWSSAKKVQVGTSNTWESSLVWFTNAQGALTETYYPTIDKAQIKDAQLLVSDGKTFFLEERTGVKQNVEAMAPSLVKLVNEDHKKRFSISHTFYTMARNHALVDEVVIQANVDGLSFYSLINPALNNTGFSDNGRAEEDKLVFWEGDTSLKVSSTTGFEKTSIGYVGFTDGFQDLMNNFKMDNAFKEASNGNLAGTGKLKIPAKKGVYKFYIVYNFGADQNFFPAQLAAGKRGICLEVERLFKDDKNS